LERLGSIGGRRTALRSLWHVTDIPTSLEGDLCLDAAPEGDLVVVVANGLPGGIAEISLRLQHTTRVRRDEGTLGWLRSVTVDPQLRFYAMSAGSHVKVVALQDYQWLT